MAYNLYENEYAILDKIDPLSRVFILNIPTHVNTETLRKRFEKYGDVELYTCQNCENDKGWAFVGYKSRRSVKRLMRKILRKQKSN
ncbi:RNA recognition motif family protein [Theileria parva strain Muguga]|uniref:RNA recognition motif family protein n=1 Tax=Theileria parva strain Muguga TaxID=333668 RepID=UPI001C61C6F7|nr:RNA recognition motif family protein [Theileria parva strain Muguga]KAF5153378.1 RNA recognition motif family protein [Theileria parva strain Muguga]